MKKLTNSDLRCILENRLHEFQAEFTASSDSEQATDKFQTIMCSIALVKEALSWWETRLKILLLERSIVEEDGYVDTSANAEKD